jgi:hypothetical protein
MNIYISREGEQFGPYTLDQVKEYLDQGSILSTDLAWKETSNSWIPIPALLGSNEPTIPLSQRLTEAFTGPVKPVRVKFLYQLGLLVVTIGMILLPILYTALVTFTAYGVYFHAVHNQKLSHIGGKVGLILYFGPLIGGVVAVFFMFKPLFARRRISSESITLNSGDYPLLFCFVEQVCRTIKAPLPKQINVDCQVNASAGFRRGWLSFFGNDLALTIGLPLVSGLNLRQLAGVLAHEFGHFSQGTGMRLTYIIRSINGWFARVVYQRDSWDAALEDWSQEGGYVTIVVLITRLFVGVTRGILWILMMVGHSMSCFMMRQMEYDADRYATQLTGTQDFIETTYRIQLLAMTQNEVFREATRESRIATPLENIPTMVANRAGKVKESAFSKIREKALEVKTGLLDTHPSHKDRIRNACLENSEGVFRLEEESSILFPHFRELSEQATSQFYENIYAYIALSAAEE